MIIDHTDCMIAPLRPHVDDRCPGAALCIVSPYLWPVVLLPILATFNITGCQTSVVCNELSPVI